MKKHILYCNPAKNKYRSNEIKFYWEKEFDIKNLPSHLLKHGRVKVTFEKYIPLKSLKQLGYLHAGIYLFLEKELYEATGMSKDDWHNELKSRFGVKTKSVCGCFDIIKSHAKYDEKEMAFFITQTINWVWDFFQVRIPPPTVIEEYI